MTDTHGRRERYAVALYNTLETSPFHTPWEDLGPLRRTVWYARAEAAMAVADAEHAVVAPPADRAALRNRIAAAIRDAACSGDCGKTEEECAKERIQPFAWHHGRLAVVEGEPEQFADAVLAVLPPPVDQAAAVPSIPSKADTAPADESPHIYMTAIRHQAAHVHDFTKAGQMTDALEHVEAIERLLAVYRRAVGVQDGAQS